MVDQPIFACTFDLSAMNEAVYGRTEGIGLHDPGILALYPAPSSITRGRFLPSWPSSGAKMDYYFGYIHLAMSSRAQTAYPQTLDRSLPDATAPKGSELCSEERHGPKSMCETRGFRHCPRPLWRRWIPSSITSSTFRCKEISN